NRIIATRIVSVDIEYFDRIKEFLIIPFEMEAMLDFLPPKRSRPLAFGHAWKGGARHDPIEASEIDSPAHEPGIDDISFANVFHPDGPIRLPGLLERLPDPLRRAAVPAVHRALLHHAVLNSTIRDLLDVPLRYVRRVMIRRPGSQRNVRHRAQQRDGTGQQNGAHGDSSRKNLSVKWPTSPIAILCDFRCSARCEPSP